MQQVDFRADKLRRSEFENACRGFWLAYVMMETGEPIGNKKPTFEHANEHRCTSFWDLTSALRYPATVPSSSAACSADSISCASLWEVRPGRFLSPQSSGREPWP